MLITDPKSSLPRFAIKTEIFSYNTIPEFITTSMRHVGYYLLRRFEHFMFQNNCFTFAVLVPAVFTAGSG